jgi:hypothetical protein
MRRRGRPIPELELSAEECGALEHWARRPKTAQATALRARLIMGCRDPARGSRTSCTPPHAFLNTRESLWSAHRWLPLGCHSERIFDGLQARGHGERL